MDLVTVRAVSYTHLKSGPVRGRDSKELAAYEACAEAVHGDLTLYRLLFSDLEEGRNRI